MVRMVRLGKCIQAVKAAGDYRGGIEKKEGKQRTFAIDGDKGGAMKAPRVRVSIFLEDRVELSHYLIREV